MGIIHLYRVEAALVGAAPRPVTAAALHVFEGSSQVCNECRWEATC